MAPRSVQSLRTYDSPADRIRQHRQVDKRPVVLVEGPSDRLLLEDAFDEEFVAFPAGSRQIALDAAKRLAEWKLSRIACVVDRDFDDVVEATENEMPELHPYENADLEAMLVLSPAFKRMVMELGSSAKLTTLGGFEAFRRSVSEIACIVSILRRANYEEKWGLAFDRVNLASKVDSRTMDFNLRGYCTALQQTSDSAPGIRILMEYANGSKKVRRQPKCPRGSSPYFRGRDALAVTGVGLRSRAGTCVKAVTEVEHLEKVLRLAGEKTIASSAWGKELASKLSG